MKLRALTWNIHKGIGGVDRRYRPDRVPRELLLECIDCARLAPSAANLQPLQYVAVEDPDLVREMYGMVK